MRSESEMIEAMKQALKYTKQGALVPVDVHTTKLLLDALRAALAEDAMQRLTGVQQEMDCYGDGNVYRGQRSSDSKTPMLTFSKAETVEPVAWISYESLGRLKNGGNSRGAVPVHTIQSHTAKIPLYTAPPKRKPLTKEQLLYVYNQLPNWGMDMDSISQDLVSFARAIERAHGIGGEE